MTIFSLLEQSCRVIWNWSLALGPISSHRSMRFIQWPSSRRPCCSFPLAAILVLTSCDKSTPVSETFSTTTPKASASAEWFKDVTEDKGITFVHRGGTNYFMPDQMGSGVVLFDY